ncbi:hypothetical protein AKJ09_01715 [Labilithrix luteola]|uniref:Uncharacterized protein n=1 Tax=Labilithrix luteola TaxID=1391654 RepID=A0A0K1PNS2_9BACT|nr:hypothetical protein AKJ09_01715 [Labilithrix luteola]
MSLLACVTFEGVFDVALVDVKTLGVRTVVQRHRPHTRDIDGGTRDTQFHARA